MRSGIGCKVKITLDAGDRFIAQTHVHSHDPVPEKLYVVKARAGMKRAPKNTAEKTQNISALNVEGLNEDTLARLPNVETLRRDVRRNRNAIIQLYQMPKINFLLYHQIILYYYIIW